MKTDGGPAFPLGSGDMRDPMGMSLRDYFAGQALSGLLTKYTLNTPDDQDTVAKMGYQLADAMLAERAKGE